MKKVLIALDYDPTSQKVAESGFSLAKTMGAEITLLHVISEPANYTSPGHVTILGFAGYLDKDTLELDSTDGLLNAAQLFLDRTKEHLGDKAIQTIIKEGAFAETILEVSRKLKADVIIMGSHSRKWLENIVMGSVTEKVLHQTTIPLFVIPTKKLKKK